MSVLHALAQAAAAAAVVVPPTGPALTAEIRTRDAAFFAAFFERCDRRVVAAYLTPDFEMYHDKGGKLAGGAAVFLDDYMKSCTAAAKPDGWRHRRELVESSLRVEAVPGFGAIEEGDHDFYEGKGDGPKRKVGTAHFVQLWRRAQDGWRLARVFSYSHRETS
ncbi:nuclear transport factor 2 family protein [Sphingomonas yunnanensis]|uniref:nuclear transport factor 2 family protein n=1 Tax=Sphingomonas yunnanensis TaxID=310400 RepID=UPI001CA66F72|nr:nuclear transport factor 2 family protein [Sphingomonas yunnanensis]